MAEEDVAETDYTHVFYGEVRGQHQTDDFVKKLFDHSKGARSETPISRAQFTELRRRLGEAGLFTLPRPSGTEPPQGTDFFLVEADGARDVYTKPPSSGVGPDTPEGKRRRIWRDAVRVFLTELPPVTSR